MLITITGAAPATVRPRRRHLWFRSLGEAAAAWDMPLVVTPPAVAVKGLPDHVTGWMYAGEAGWQRRRLVVPERAVVYDAMYLEDLRHHRRAHRRLTETLAECGIAAFNPVLPPKDEVYRLILADRAARDVLPPTRFRVTPRAFLQLAEAWGAAWWKPVYGSGGRNMLFVRPLARGRWYVAGERFFGRAIRREMDREDLLRLLSFSLRHRRYMAQGHIPLWRLEDGRLLDLRVTVQCDHDGRWGVLAVTGRSAARGAMVTNYHAGGRVQSLTRPTEAQWIALKRAGVDEETLDRAGRRALRVARTLQRTFPTLGVLGVDVGGSQGEDRCYVYDVNSRPGRDILTDAELVAFARGVAGFAHHLLLRPGSQRT
ncbi:YheC/YheD family protein [Alicyclobacillus sp.]|uniref:YheC/YheD family protein n=1 Tax=Alicyclobacillus sp. TaxID=61169 RepID=UPI0025BFCD6A|nr:YheC/YheD family protein [Alicyclobacillus sp.]MCL6515732.1 YheC/YheD family protein [Alicyclobacillus sp.]